MMILDYYSKLKNVQKSDTSFNLIDLNKKANQIEGKLC